MATLEAARADAAAYLKALIDTGYATREQLVESVQCWLADGLKDAVQFAEPLVDQALDDRRAAEETWSFQDRS